MKKTRITLEDAVKLLCNHANIITQAEDVPLLNAPGRILAQDIYAAIDLPPFNRSAQDGYAACSTDLINASPDVPAVLSVCDRLFAGNAPKQDIEPGKAVRIMTGAPIPLGADCVVRQEDTDLGMETVKIYSSFAHNQNICFQGEDVRAGALLFHQGTRLDWTHIAALAGQGFTTVRTYQLPKVAIMTTGDELTPPGSKLTKGHLYDSNGPMLYARVSALNMIPLLCPSAGDDTCSIAKQIERTLPECDILLTTGGVSVGTKDCMAAVAETLGAKILFHGLAAKPGSPALAMIINGKVIICLSGNPFATVAIFETVVHPVLEYISGNRIKYPRQQRGILHGHFEKASPTRRLIRAKAEGSHVFIPETGHSSGMVSTLAGCNCLIDVPAGSGPLNNGDPVNIFML